MSLLSNVLGSTYVGAQGPTGPAATVSVGTVTSSGPAAVTNTGSSTAAILNFNLPVGTFSWPTVGIPVSTGSAWGTSKAAPAGTILGTTDIQVVTNKDLSDATNTFPSTFLTASSVSTLTNKNLSDATNTFPSSLATLNGAQRIINKDFGDASNAFPSSLLTASSTAALTNKNLSDPTNTFPSSLVTLTGTQTLTNKNLSDPTNTFPSSLVTLTGTQTLTNKSLTGGTIDGVNIGFRNIPSVGADKTTSYTIGVTDVGKFVTVGTAGSITIPTSVFAAGDIVSMFNNTTGPITITCTAPTTYIGGTNTVKTSVTLATRGMCNAFFYSPTVCIITGNVS